MTINIGIIGAARVAVYAMIAPARDVPRVNVAAIAARDPARARTYAAEHGIAKVHASYEALIADPSIDLVYLATPSAFHAAIAVKALEAGKHVLVEKPFSMNAVEAQRVLTAAERAGRRVFEAYYYRHHTPWHRIVDVCRSGALGRIVSLDAAFHAPIAKSADEFRWNASIGGGALMDIGCYPLQWVRVATGEEPVVERAVMRMVDGKTRSETIEGLSTFAAQLQAVAATLLDGAPFPLAADDPVKSMAVIDAVRSAAARA